MSVAIPLKAKQEIPQPGSIDLRTLVWEALHESRTAYKEIGPPPHCEGVLPPHLLCLADAEELSQLLKLFFPLAFQNAGPHGRLTILTGRFEEKVRLSIVADPPWWGERREATLIVELPLALPSINGGEI